MPDCYMLSAEESFTYGQRQWEAYRDLVVQRIRAGWNTTVCFGAVQARRVRQCSREPIVRKEYGCIVGYCHQHAVEVEQLYHRAFGVTLSFVPKPRILDKNRPWSVYVIEGSLTGLVKIGRALSSEKRIRALEKVSGQRLNIIHIIELDDFDSACVVETRLHRLFDEARRDGEWFDPTNPGLAQWLEKLTKRKVKCDVK